MDAPYPGTPSWVKAVLAVLALGVLLVLTLHLAGVSPRH